MIEASCRHCAWRQTTLIAVNVTEGILRVRRGWFCNHPANRVHTVYGMGSIVHECEPDAMWCDLFLGPHHERIEQFEVMAN